MPVITVCKNKSFSAWALSVIRKDTIDTQMDTDTQTHLQLQVY